MDDNQFIAGVRSLWEDHTLYLSKVVTSRFKCGLPGHATCTLRYLEPPTLERSITFSFSSERLWRDNEESAKTPLEDMTAVGREMRSFIHAFANECQLHRAQPPT